MSDPHRSTTRVLDLIGRPGAYKAMLVLYQHDTATVAQIAAGGCLRPLPLLRSLAAEGLILSASRGTWDGDPPVDMPFALTGAGRELVGCLNDFQQWAHDVQPPRSRLIRFWRALLP